MIPEPAALGDDRCEQISDVMEFGAKATRRQLSRMLNQRRAADVAIAPRLDRLARTTRYLLEIAA
jgi:DNA invertase Pin-like site-specific DNA recombinase